AHARGASQLIGVTLELIAQMERRVTRALPVILVRDRCAEERHDAVAGELVDEPLEALDPLREDLEEAVHDLRPRFRVELLRQLHRALHIGEQYGDLLALAFEGGFGLQNLVGEVFGRVSAYLDIPGLAACGFFRFSGWPEWRAAFLTELGAGRVGRAALRASAFERFT